MDEYLKTLDKLPEKQRKASSAYQVFTDMMAKYNMTLGDVAETLDKTTTKTEELGEAEKKRIKEAQERAHASTTAKAQTAYDTAYEQSMDEVKLKVIKEYRAEVEAKEKDLSKKVGEF
jgi:hypothetical protein